MLIVYHIQSGIVSITLCLQRNIVECIKFRGIPEREKYTNDIRKNAKKIEEYIDPFTGEPVKPSK